VPTSDKTGRPSARAKQHASGPPSADSPATRPEASVSTFTPRYELWALVAICLLAAARVFFGAAALPFFADTDEQAHFDLVHKLARGYWPAGEVERRDTETAEVAIFNHSPEFSIAPDDYPRGQFPPPVRTWPAGQEKTAYVAYLRNLLHEQPNHEAHSPPVYYALAGLWYDLGRLLGPSRPETVYWVRFFNAPLYAALVATAYALCRPYFGRDNALAVAALTAFFPNTVFFTVNSDVLSPLAVALTLLLVLRWYEREQPGWRLPAAAGAVAAAAVLVKLTNAAVLVVMAAVILVRFRRDRQPVKLLRESWPLLLTASLPLLLWGVRNRMTLGDWTGTSAKVRQLTWTPKPLTELLNHPIFTPNKLAAFLTKLTTNFFDGDANWHGGPARSAAADWFFLATSALLPAVGLAVAVRYGAQEPRARFFALMSALAVVSFFGVLVFLSMRFDFGECAFPSRDFPFFTSGRLVSGALVPFLALYAYGVGALVGRRPALIAGATAVAVSMMVLGQLAYVTPALSSQYNWFHLP
jgi:hypothetical protein